MARPRTPGPAASHPVLSFPEPASPAASATPSPPGTGGGRAAPRLICGPPGSGKTHEALSALDDAVAAHGPDRALLLLPTYGDVEHARRVTLSRRGVGGVLDAPFSTFTSLPERLLPGARVATLPSRTERDLLAGEALRAAAGAPFSRVHDRKGFRARFLRLVKEMKQTGDDPEALRARARSAAAALAAAARERWLAFLDAWERYDALLARAAIADHEDVLRDLLRRLVDDPPASVGRLAFFGADGFDDLTGLEQRLVSALARAVQAGGGTVLVALTLDEARPDLFAPARRVRSALVAEGFVEETIEAARRAGGALAHLARVLFGLGAPRVPSEGAVQWILGADPLDEVERIGREIRRLVDPARSDLEPRREGEGPLAFRDVGIVFRRLDRVGPLAQRTLAALGVPTRLVGAGPRLSAEAVVRALRGPLALLRDADGRAGGGEAQAEDDFDAASVLDWLRWRALAGAPSSLTPSLVDGADFRWRKDGFPADWPAFSDGVPDARWRAALAPLEEARASCAAARGPDAVWNAIADAVEALLPLPRPGGFDARGVPLDPEGDERLRRAASAKRRVLEIVAGLRAAAARTGLFADLDARRAVASLLEAIDEATCPLPDRRLDVVTLLDAEEARHYELPVVFVAGLVEKEFPLQPREDVFLRDDDREALRRAAGATGERLGTAREAEERERRLLLQALTRARRRLYLCRHATDEGGRDKAPSLVWHEVADVLSERRPDGVERPFGPEKGVPAPAELDLDDALSARDLERFVASHLGDVPRAGREDEVREALALARTGPPRVAAILARAARFRRETEDPLGPVALPAFVASVESVTPTSANDGWTCRHRFFLRHVAKVPNDDVPVGGRPFDRRDLGTLVHEALRLALVRPDAPPERVAAEALTAHPPAGLSGGGARAALEAEVARVVELFRRREADAGTSGFRPSTDWLELEIGAEGREVTLGEEDARFLLEGQIDRVDALGGPAPAAVIVDYKLGKGTAAKAMKAALEGDDLQLPLYARAVESALGLRVVGVEWYAASARLRAAAFDASFAAAFETRREGPRGKALSSAEFRALLDRAERSTSKIVRDVRAGRHRKLPREPEACDTCSQRPVCRPDVFRFRREAAP